MPGQPLETQLQTPHGPLFVRVDEATGTAVPTAPPVVLLHALGTDLSIWDGLTHDLVASRRVIRIDAPGHGRSPAWPAVNLPAIARSVCVVAHQLGVERIDLVGTSMGAVVGLQAATFEPALVRRLVLVGALLTRTDTSAQEMHSRAAQVARTGMGAMADQMLARWFPPRSDGDDRLAMARLRALLLQTDPRAYAACSDALSQYDLSDALRKRQHDSLLITGADDGGIDTQFAQLHRDLPGTRLVTMAETGHFPNLQRPRAFAEQVTGFLAAT